MTEKETNETPSNNTGQNKTRGEQAKDALGTAKNATESAKTIVEGASNAISMVKWVAIAIVSLVIFGSGYAAYKIISAPAKAVGEASKAVSESVKSGASTVKESTTDMLNRLVIPSSDRVVFDTLSEQSFNILTERSEAPAESMKQRLYWRANLGGHENKVCEFTADFTGQSVPIVMAADNKDYATSKSLGSKKDRLMRIVIRAEGDDIPINIEWDDETSQWISKWKATTVKKPMEDNVAEQRILEVLRQSAVACQ
jgi:Sec-independent protein translocase protein TatA